MIRLYLSVDKALLMKHVNSLKNIFLGIIFLIGTQLSFSQQDNTIDSLQQVLKKTIVDTIKINTLNELAWELRKNDSKKAAYYAAKAYEISDSLNDLRNKATSLSRLGTAYIYSEEYKKAEKIFLELLEIEKHTNYTYGIGRANNQLGRIYKKQGKLVQSIQFRLRSLKAFEKISDSTQIALVANNIGNTYKELYDFELAVKYLTKSLTIDRQLGNSTSVIKTLTNLGALHNEMEDYEKALKYLSSSEEQLIQLNDLYWLSKTYIDLSIAHMKLKNYDKSLSYLNKAKEIKEKMGKENDEGLYNNFGTLYEHKGNLDKALEYYQKSISKKSASKEYNFLDAKVNIAGVLFKKKEYGKAIKEYEEALALTDNYEKTAVKLKIYNDLSACYEAIQQNDKALMYKNEYVKLNKQIKASHIKAIHYETAYNEQQKEIELLQTSAQLTKTKLEKSEAENTLKQTKILALSIGLLIAVLLFFLIYRASKLKAKAKIAEKNSLLEAKKTQELLDKQEIRFNQARLDGQEKERTRIAKDLHDRLGSILAMVKVHYKSVEDQIENLKTSNNEHYKKANTLLDEACEEVRKIAHDIHSGILAKFGLVAAIEDLAITLNDSKQIYVEFNTYGIDDRLNNNIEITVYRIIQELINNILKHAKASEVSIQLLQNENTITIMVEDNGVGFEYNPKNIEGMGLKNVTSRVKKLQGEIFIDSEMGNGTTTSINIPLKDI